MQTGYDNYWMYQNNRPGPLHNLQNNDHYSNAVFTDNNRHVRKGRLLNHFNDCTQYPNNVAYYHQSNQYRSSDFHEMWPSSEHLVPFRPSNVNNTQPRRAPVNWSGSSGYLPQNSYTHENFNVRYSENQSKYSQVSSSTNKNNIRVHPAPASSSINQISRIRVKDVYSINNNIVSDSLLYNSLRQSHSKRQRESVINYVTNNYSAIDLNPQSKFTDSSHLAQPKLPPPYYRHTATEQPQEFCSQFGSSRPSMVASKNNTSSFLPQEVHPPGVNQNAEMQKIPRESPVAPQRPDNTVPRARANQKAPESTNSGQLGSVQTYDRITNAIFNAGNNPQIENYPQNELENTAHLATLSSSKTSAYGTFGISNSNHVSPIPNCHKNVSESGGDKLASINSPKAPGTNLNSQETSNPETSSQDVRQEGTLIKISIPHTGQSSFIRLNNSNSKSSSSKLSLPCLLESYNELFNAATPDLLSNRQINNNECINSSMFHTTVSENTINSPPTSVESHQNSGSSILSNSSESRKVMSPKQSLINVNKENVNKFASNSVPQNDFTPTNVPIPEENIKLNLLSVKQEKSLTSAENIREDDHSKDPHGSTKFSEVPIPEKNIKLNLLTIKQEKSPASAESFHEDGHSNSGTNELNGIITKQKIPVEETLEDNSARLSENLKTLEKSSPALEETGNSDSTEVKTFPKKNTPSEKPESESKSLRNSVPEGQRLKKKVRQHHSFKSKINRVKLDMLIQFLEKDNEPVQTTLETPCEKTTSENIKCGNDEKHRRRKISKTCVVKNKNISREMVSLMSQKTSRVDPSKSSSQISQTVKSNMDSQKGKEGKETETGGNLKNENCTSSTENQPQKEDSSQSERNNTNELVTGEVQKPAVKCLPEEKDKEMINMMRILRTMSTNFCINCKFSSSADSFWVNVVSFELRCLNCFKKFFPKVFNTKNDGFDTGKQEVNSGNENSLKDVDNPNCFSESVNCNSEEIQQEKSNDLKEENLTDKLPEDSSKGRRESFEKSKRKKSLKEGEMTEGRKNSEENISLGKTKKKNSLIPNSIREKSERKSSCNEESTDENSNKKMKDQHMDNKSRAPENECKSEKLLKSPSKEMENKEGFPKKEKKGNVDTPKRKSSTESASNKTDECAKKERKRPIDSPAQSTKKAKESFQKEKTAEQTKISKHGQQEMSEIPQIPSKSKEIRSSNDSKTKSDSSNLKRKKSFKRKHSDDDPSPLKVYIPDDHSGEKKEVIHSSDKTKSSTTTSKDVNQKIKMENENQISKSSTDNSKT